MTGGGAASALGMLSVTKLCCNWMYLDPYGQVCVGRGHVLPSATHAASLPWVQAFTPNGGALAAPEQIADEWYRVKACQAAAHLGGGSFKRMTTLRLRDEDLPVDAT